MGVYEDLGVEPIINACGSVTRLGGAPMTPEVLAAFQEASQSAVPIEKLQAAASKVIADITGAEAGLVTAGASSALTLGAAAILAGFDLRRMEQLPCCDGFPNEFLIAREQRNGYDHAVRAAGAQLIEVGFNELVSGAGVRRTEAWEYLAAVGPRTVGILYVLTTDSRPPLAEVASAAKSCNLRVLVDAAAELPPRSNLRHILACGADLVAFSGGKALRGPQSTGILCGTRDLIGSAALQLLDMDDHPQLWDPPAELIDRRRIPGMPRHGIGRGFKVSKEEIVALITALRRFAAGVDLASPTILEGWLQRIANGLQGSSVQTQLHASADGEQFPCLDIKIDHRTLGKSAFELCRELRTGSPPVYPGHSRLAEGVLIVHPLCLQESQIQPLIKRLNEVLL